MSKYRDMIVRELMHWLSQSDKDLLRVTPKEQLIGFHHGLGTAIRNEYELWMPEHEVTAIWHQCERDFPLASEPPNMPEELIFDGKLVKIQGTGMHVDDHPCHPDNFSSACIRALWEKLQ